VIDSEFEATYAALLSDLSAIVVLLRRYSQEFWAARLEDETTRLQAGDFYAFGDLLGTFGGMGSLNDVILLDQDPAFPLGRVSEANDELRELCDRIYFRANLLRREWRNNA
jgi:hypothetical protein